MKLEDAEMLSALVDALTERMADIEAANAAISAGLDAVRETVRAAGEELRAGLQDMRAKWDTHVAAATVAAAEFREAETGRRMDLVGQVATLVTSSRTAMDAMTAAYDQRMKALDEAIARALTVEGKEGPPGRDGKDGQDGAPGVDGAPGADGKDGQDGAPGADGKDGTDGRDGLPGQPGRDGKDGQDGAPGKDGEPGKDGAPGADGKHWNPAGTFDAAKTYDHLDVVWKDGQGWLARKDAPQGVPGENAPDWQLILRRGDRGKAGQRGEDGRGIESMVFDMEARELLVAYTDGTTQRLKVDLGGNQS